MKKDKIIITGASGFIGTNLVDNLQNAGYNNLLSLDKKQFTNKQVNTVIGSFFDEKILNNTIKKNDIVIHLACSTIPSSSEENRLQDISENIIGTLKLLQICAEKKVKKFIFFSSGGTVYGDHGKKTIKETEKTNPICSHGIMKLTIENYIQVYNRLHNLNYVIIRPSNPYGRIINSNKNQGIVDIFLKKAINNELLEIWGDGEIVRDYIHIDDLANFIVKVIKQDIKNEIFNIGTGIGTSVNKLIEVIQGILGKKLQTTYLEHRNFDAEYNVLNIEKAKKMLNWQPKVTINEGVAKIYKTNINL